MIVVAVVGVFTFFKLLAEHLRLFFQLSLSCGAASTFIVPAFSARRFPSFQSHNNCPLFT
jgi:hypothetical protein